jgi:transposase
LCSDRLPSRAPRLLTNRKRGECMSKGKKQSTFQRLESGNRRQRKDIQRRLYAENPGLEIVHPHAAGIDIGNESHFVAVAPAADPQPVREFGSWTADLNRMAGWLKSCGVTTVAMQSTGVYWFAVYDILEEHGLQVFLVNARHTKNLPGRKSDVQESQWLLKLHTYGLLRNSFRPPHDIRQLRTIWRLRERHVREAGRTIQHMQKALTAMNIHLANTISDLSGVSGQAIIRAILQGERDPGKLAGLRDRRIKASEEEIARSLEGIWRDDYLFELQQAVDEYDMRQKQLAECDRRLEAYLGALPTRPSPATDGQDGEPTPPGTAARRKKRKKPSRNAPKSFALATELTRVAGVDATRIDGVDVMTIMTVVAELGVDPGAHWPTEGHFTSWLSLSPKRDISGGKVIRHIQEKSSNRVASVLRMAATSLLHSDSFLGARYRHLRTRLGAPKAIKAMARYLACLIYRLLTRGQQWVDRGTQNFEIKQQQRELSALERKASSLGLRLVPVSQQAA